MSHAVHENATIASVAFFANNSFENKRHIDRYTAIMHGKTSITLLCAKMRDISEIAANTLHTALIII